MEDGVNESQVSRDKSQVSNKSQVSRDLKPNIKIDLEDNSEKIQIILDSYLQTTAITTINNRTTTNTISEEKCTSKKLIKWAIIILAIVVVLVIALYITIKVLKKKKN